MKKYWPVLLFLAGVLVLGGVYFFVVRGRSKELPVDEEEIVAEIPLEMRPLVSLTPTGDGHYLELKIEKLKVDAASLDYEVLYQTGGGITQGVPGTVTLGDEDPIEREILLGSESSGKFRYDEGVEDGTLTIRFRDDKGKLVGKLMTEFHLQSGVDLLTSVDGKFSYQMSGIEKTFFVTMETFGVPEMPSGEVVAGPFGSFSSESGFEGEVKLEGNVVRWGRSDWEEATSNDDIGIFVGLASE
jgi:hypothetical protein